MMQNHELNVTTSSPRLAAWDAFMAALGRIGFTPLGAVLIIGLAVLPLFPPFKSRLSEPPTLRNAFIKTIPCRRARYFDAVSTFV